MKWTNKQLEAINHTGENILVSAGAGSGKTAILSERVIRILKEGTHINELLILTFTKAASEEMKERIAQNIKDEGLIQELDLIDSSYITTFDSFALSMVKKYHYLVNVDKDISIIDESILKIEKEVIIPDNLNVYKTLLAISISFIALYGIFSYFLEKEYEKILIEREFKKQINKMIEDKEYFVPCYSSPQSHNETNLR